MKIKYSTSRIHEITDQKKSPKINIYSGAEKKTKEPRSTLSYLLIFFLVVSSFILVSLCIRFAVFYLKSTYNTTTYSVYIVSERPFVITYDSQLKQLSEIYVQPFSDDRLLESAALGIPLDGEIKADGITPQNFSAAGFIFSQIFNPWKYRFQDMTVLDSIRLGLDILNASQKDIGSVTLKRSKSGDVTGATQEQLYNIFKGSKMVNEQKSIEVINATDITGLGGFASRVVKNAGGSVVSITSGNSAGKSSLIASSSSETLKRLSQILGIKPTLKEKHSSIADIQIILGLDFGKKVEKAVE